MSSIEQTTLGADARTTRKPLTGGRRVADLVFSYGYVVFAVGLVVQVFLAGLGIFGANSGPIDSSASLDPHRTWGDVLGVIAVVLLLISLYARVNRATMIGALVAAILTEVAQHGLAQAGLSHAWAGGLHAVDGFVILGLAVWLSHDGMRRRRAS